MFCRAATLAATCSPVGVLLRLRGEEDPTDFHEDCLEDCFEDCLDLDLVRDLGAVLMDLDRVRDRVRDLEALRCAFAAKRRTIFWSLFFDAMHDFKDLLSVPILRLLGGFKMTRPFEVLLY